MQFQLLLETSPSQDAILLQGHRISERVGLLSSLGQGWCLIPPFLSLS